MTNTAQEVKKFHEDLVKDFLRQHLGCKKGIVLEGIIESAERGNDVFRSDGKIGIVKDYVIKNCTLRGIRDSIFRSYDTIISFEKFNLVGGIHRKDLEVGDRIVVHIYDDEVFCYANLSKKASYSHGFCIC